MSSKTRQKARKWMKAVAARHQVALNRQIDIHRRDIQNLKEDLTKMIPPDDPERFFYPQGKIEQPFINVASNRHTFERFNYDKPPPPFYMADNMKIYHLQAEQFALVLPDGRNVVWWGWKLR